MSRAARFSMLLDPPNLLRRAAVALVAGVGSAVLRAVPLVELAEEAEGATEGRLELPTCTPLLAHQALCQEGHCLVNTGQGQCRLWLSVTT